MKYFVAILIYILLISSMPDANSRDKISVSHDEPYVADTYASANDGDAYQMGTESIVATSPITGLYAPNLPGLSKWVFPSLDSALGLGLFDVADVDADGALEIITTGAGFHSLEPHSIFVLEFSLDKAVCLLPDFLQTVFDHRIVQMDQDAALEVFLVTDHGTVVFDGKTCEVQEQHLFSELAESATFADMDGDGVLEIAYSVNGDLRVAQWNDPENYIEKQGFGGRMIRAGSLVTPGKDDLAVQSNVLFLLNGEDLSTINELQRPLTSYLELADITGDGLSEVLVGVLWDEGMTVFNSDGTEQLFNRPVSNLGYLGSQDLDGDGDAEILLADRQYGEGYALDELGNELWQIDNFNSGVSGMVVIDGDALSSSKLAWSVGSSTTGRDTIDILDLSNGELLDRSARFGDAFQTESIDSSRVAVLSTWSETVSMGLHVVDRQTGLLMHSIDVPSYINLGNEADDLAVGVLDEVTEQIVICISKSVVINWSLRCYDADNYSLITELEVETGAYSYIKLIDVDMNGSSELLGLNTAGYLTAYSPLNGNILWRSQDLALDISDIWGLELVHAIDGMLWILDSAGNLRVLDGNNGTIVRAEDSTPLRYFDVRNGEIYAVRQDEGIGKIDPATLQFSEIIYPSTDTLVALEVAEDGNFLVTGFGERPRMQLVIVSLDFAFDPWVMIPLHVRDIQATSWEDVLISTHSGVINVPLTSIFSVFRDSFEKP